MLETRMANYTTLTALPEMSKSYCMEKYLDWDEEEIKANSEALKKDKTLGFAIQPEEFGSGFGGGSPAADTGDRDLSAPKKTFKFPRKKKPADTGNGAQPPDAETDKEEDLVLNG
jgi:hypothetical protein